VFWRQQTVAQCQQTGGVREQVDAQQNVSIYEDGSNNRLGDTALYASPDIIRVIKTRTMRWAGHVARIWEIRNAYKILVGKPEWKRPFRRPRHRWEDNIRMDLRETGWEGVDWIHLYQDTDQWRAVVNTVMICGLHIRREIS
jgi:hypothetical protein